MCRNCLLTHFIEERYRKVNIVTRRRGRRSKQLLDDFKKKKGYWNPAETKLLKHSKTYRPNTDLIL